MHLSRGGARWSERGGTVEMNEGYECGCAEVGGGKCRPTAQEAKVAEEARIFLQQFIHAIMFVKKQFAHPTK